MLLAFLKYKIKLVVILLINFNYLNLKILYIIQQLIYVKKVNYICMVQKNH